MAESSADIVIVGGGIAGMTTAYYLAKSGVPSVVVERDAIGSHASGFAYGGLSPLSGFGIPGPLAEIAQNAMRLHRELSKSLLEETGIDVDFRVRSSLALAFTEADVRRLQAALPWQQRQPGYAVRWLGWPIDVRPLKVQILRLQAPGPPIECSVGWGHNYATTKTDGLLWAGTTEEEAGFDEESTLAARDEIGAALLRMLPAMADAQV